MIENREISDESQYNFHFRPHFNTNTAEPIHLFLNDEEHKAKVHFFSEHDIKKVKMLNFDICKNPPKLIGYHRKVHWTTTKPMSFYNLHTCLYHS